MRVIAVTNQKGGTAKTTTTINVAAGLGELSQRVLVIDLDPQGSASRWLGAESHGGGLLDVFLAGRSLAPLAVASSAPGVDLVPGSSLLGKTETALAAEAGREFILRRAVNALPPSRWDWVLLDCPPAMGLLTVNALSAATGLLVPVEAHAMALDGLAYLLENVGTVRERLNPGLILEGFVLCRVDGRTRHAGQMANELRGRFGKAVFAAAVRENVRLAECPARRVPVTVYDTKCNGTVDYRAVAEELLLRELMA